MTVRDWSNRHWCAECIREADAAGEPLCPGCPPYRRNALRGAGRTLRTLWRTLCADTRGLLGL